MKHVLVTGAYGGMGKAVINRLSGLGFHVFAIDKHVEKESSLITPIKADLTDENSLISAFDIVREKCSELFAILHFAGIYNLDSLVEISDEEFRKILEINLLGAYRVNKIFLPLLKKDSRILITTSELAPLAPLPFTGLYAITKSALDNYAYSLRMELQLLGIKVIVLRPGAVDTGMIGNSTYALDRFCNNTSLYKVNAKKFSDIVNKVEARKIPTEKLAKKAVKIICKKRVKQVYKINRNPLLLILNVLPKRLQTAIIRKILKTKS